jgi:phosphoglycerate dehydrogenase-like enzyme
LAHQKTNNPDLTYIHSLSAGIDNYMPHLPENITLTNAKGAFSSILAEFVLLGILYFDKQVPHFLEAKKNK